jgi:signal transduction histidine kinase
MIEKIVQQIKCCSDALVETDIWTLSPNQRQAVATIVRYAGELDNMVSTMSALTPERMGKMIRHEFLNLLTPLLGYAEMLREGWIGALDQHQQTLVENISASAHELRDSVRLLSESKDYVVLRSS